MKRIIDLIIAGCASVILLPLILLTCLLVAFTSRGPVIYWSRRLGRANRIFMMPKFRSMKCDTPILPTDLLVNPSMYLTPVGSFIRNTSLDELPQLWSILKGDMSFVGPRPALFNQYNLIKLRSDFGIDRLTPGLTGWAQVNGRDEVSDYEKVKFDLEYLQNASLLFDLKIMYLTISKVFSGSGVSH